MARRKKKETEETAATSTTVEAAEPANATEMQPAQEAGTQAVEPGTSEGEPAQQYAIDYTKPMSLAHDNRAGVELRKFERFKQMQLHFRNPVPPSIEEQLQKQGWTFRPAEEVYTKQFGAQGPGAAYIDARRFYQELCKELTPQEAKGASR